MSNGRKMWQRNNLDRASSPYLRQHAGNPIWWQEWNRETLDHAVAESKTLLVSIGYATCHWCHVMAARAFSDPEDLFHLYTTKEPMQWGAIPVNSLQKRGDPESICHNKTCRPIRQ